MRYWEQKVAFQTPASRTYSVQLQVARRRSWLSLGTANKAQAAIEARKLYVQLKANGWSETMRRRKPAEQDVPPPRRVATTIREFVDAVRENTGILSKTLAAYARSLRKIASDIKSLHKLAALAFGPCLERSRADTIDFILHPLNRIPFPGRSSRT